VGSVATGIPADKGYSALLNHHCLWLFSIEEKKRHNNTNRFIGLWGYSLKFKLKFKK